MMKDGGLIRSEYAKKLLARPVGKAILVRSQIVFDGYRVAARRHGILITTTRTGRNNWTITKIGMKELRPRAVDPRAKDIMNRIRYK